MSHYRWKGPLVCIAVMYSDSNIIEDNQTAGSPSFLLQHSILNCTRWLTFSNFITSQTANICEMRIAGGLEGDIGECAGGGRDTFGGRRLEHDAVAWLCSSQLNLLTVWRPTFYQPTCWPTNSHIKHRTAVYTYTYIYIYIIADKSLARPGRKQSTATEDFDFHITYL